MHMLSDSMRRVHSFLQQLCAQPDVLLRGAIVCQVSQQKTRRTGSGVRVTARCMSQLKCYRTPENREVGTVFTG